MEVKNECVLFHKWSVWKDIVEPEVSEHITIKQTKECLVCGKKKGRSITYIKKVI